MKKQESCRHRLQFELHESNNHLMIRSLDQYREKRGNLIRGLNSQSFRTQHIASLVGRFGEVQSADDCAGVDHCKHALKRCGFFGKLKCFQLSPPGILNTKNMFSSILLGMLKNMFLLLKTTRKRGQHCKDRSLVVVQLFAMSTRCLWADTDAFILLTGHTH